MKTALLAIFVLLGAFMAPTLSGAADTDEPAVRDQSGKIMRTGTNYYIFPYGEAPVGLSGTRHHVCPLDVVLTYDTLEPVTFMPFNLNKGVIRTNTDLSIQFPTESRCPDHSKVVMIGSADYTGQTFLTTGGMVGQPGEATLSNWFKIQPFEDAYKLVYCPSVCSYCPHQCTDAGIYYDYGVARLALTGSPLKISFSKA